MAAKLSKQTSEVSTLKRQEQAKKAYGLVPDSVKMPALELFTGKHDGEMFRTFLNASETYFTITGISNENTKTLFAKNCFLDTAHTWYNSKGYNETMVILKMMKCHILDYFILSDYVRRARSALVACKMG